MVSLLVFDDWLPASLLETVHATAVAHRRSSDASDETGPHFSWYSPRQGRHVSRLPRVHVETAQAYVENLMARLGALLDVGDSVEGYEWWANDGNLLDWHVDRDETLFKESGRIRHPLWSTVFYTDVSIVGHGGELAVLCEEEQRLPYSLETSSREIPQKHHLIVPRTNRLVVFRRGLPHRINPFSGKRTSLAVNLWDVTPSGFPRYFESDFQQPVI